MERFSRIVLYVVVIWAVIATGKMIVSQALGVRMYPVFSWVYYK